MIKKANAVDTNSELLAAALSAALPKFVAPPVPDVIEFSTEHVLPHWRRDSELIRRVFADGRSAEKIDDLERINASRLCATDGRAIIMVLYETPWTPGGGLLQIGRRLPTEFNRLADGEATRCAPDRMYRLSPLHTNLSSSLSSDVLLQARYLGAQANLDAKARRELLDAPPTSLAFLNASVAQLDSEGNSIALVCYLGECQVPFGTPDSNGARPTFATQIYRAHDPVGGDDWILFGNEHFFLGDQTPYEYRKIPTGREDVQDQLRHDALFASKAAPYVVAALGIDSPLFHAQDWQLASVALTAKEACLEGTLARAAVVLTMHNVYDQELPSSELIKITGRIDDHLWPSVSGVGVRSTVLTRMIPLLDAPVSAVSPDLIHDLLNVPSCFGASQELISTLRRFRAVGILNGTFVSASTSTGARAAVAAVRQEKFDLILDLKDAKRANMLTHFAHFLRDQRQIRTAEGVCPIIGKLREEHTDGGLAAIGRNVPVFFTMGRFDPDQKGQDLFLEAISRLPAELDARFIVGAAGISQERFPQMYRWAEDIVEASNGRALVVSTFFTGAIRTSLQNGPNFLVMPSLYEPGGMVSEFYTQLTPVIAHSTGGLRRLVKQYSFESFSGSGLLFGIEGEALPAANSQWAQIRGEYNPAARLSVPLYDALADELARTLELATSLYAEFPEHYARLLSNLPSQVTKCAWGPSVYKYWDWFDAACN